MIKILCSLILLFVATSCVNQSDYTHSSEVSIIYPYNNEVLSGTIKIKFSSSDYRSVEKIEFWMDSTFTGSSVKNTPFEILINTEYYEDGNHIIFARCTDLWENITESKKINVIIDNKNKYPDKVKLFSIQYVEGGFNISWTKSKDIDFYEYMLFESTNPDMTGSLLIFSSKNIQDTSFIVKDLQQDEKRYYQVGVKNSNQFIAFSNIEAGSLLPKIVFISRLDGNSNIYTMDIEGDNLTQLTDSESSKSSPKFSPGGSYILFRKGNPLNVEDINIVDLFSKESYKIGRDIYGQFIPNFNHNGSKIIYSSFVGSKGDIFIIDINGDNEINVTNSPNNDRNPIFSPNETSICYVSTYDSGWAVFKMNADGTGSEQLTQSSYPLSSPINPIYSPDGKTILYLWRSEIRIMNSDGSNNKSIYKTDKQIFFSNISPDGTEIIFTLGSSQGTDNDNINIYKINIDGSNLLQLTNETGRQESPTYLKDGSKIVYSSKGEIFIMERDGSNKTQLTNNGVSNYDPYVQH